MFSVFFTLEAQSEFHLSNCHKDAILDNDIRLCCAALLVCLQMDLKDFRSIQDTACR